MRLRTIALIASLTALACTLCVAAPALAANDIAYRCHNNDICLLDPDGPFGNSVNLSDNDTASYEGYPFWSPNGSRVGFTSSFGASPSVENLFTMDPNATGNQLNVATQLTHYTSSGPTRNAEWSPDGSKVAFTHGALPGIYVVNADGSSADPVTITPPGSVLSYDTGPSFSPDGSKIAFSQSEQVYIANADGSGTPQPLPGAACHSPQWSPDGSKIACDKTKGLGSVDLEIANADGTGTPVVVSLTSVQFTDATWSPDGKRIAYRFLAPTNESYFHVMNANGTGDIRMPIVQNQNDNAPPSWSPDGSRLTFSAFYYGDGSTQADDRTEVNVTNSDGTGSTTQLTTGGVSIPVNAGNADAVWKRQAYTPPPPQPPLSGTVKPKLVWITKRIPWQPGRPLISISISCPMGSSDKRCVEAAAANGRGGVRSGGRTTGPVVRVRGKPKTVLVAKSKLTIAPGKTRKLAMKVTPAGKRLLLKRGAMKLDVTLTSRIKGQKPLVAHHTIRVYVKRKHS